MKKYILCAFVFTVSQLFCAERTPSPERDRSNELSEPVCPGAPQRPTRFLVPRTANNEQAPAESSGAAPRPQPIRRPARQRLTVRFSDAADNSHNSNETASSDA